MLGELAVHILKIQVLQRFVDHVCRGANAVELPDLLVAAKARTLRAETTALGDDRVDLIFIQLVAVARVRNRAGNTVNRANDLAGPDPDI